MTRKVDIRLFLPVFLLAASGACNALPVRPATALSEEEEEAADSFVRVDLLRSLPEQKQEGIVSSGGTLPPEAALKLQLSGKCLEAESGYCKAALIALVELHGESHARFQKHLADEEEAASKKSRRRRKKDKTPPAPIVSLDVQNSELVWSAPISLDKSLPITTANAQGKPKSFDLHPATQQRLRNFAMEHQQLPDCIQLERAEVTLLLQSDTAPPVAVAGYVQAEAPSLEKESFFFQLRQRDYIVVDPPGGEQASSGGGEPLKSACVQIKLEDAQAAFKKAAKVASLAIGGGAK